MSRTKLVHDLSNRNLAMSLFLRSLILLQEKPFQVQGKDLHLWPVL